MHTDTNDWYHETFHVYHKDVDFREELRFSSLCVMLQEVAWSHARAIGIDYSNPAFANAVWVVSRMDIRLTYPLPKWMDDVVLTTFPVGLDRMFALRDFVAYHKNGTPFAFVRSAWLVIDAKARKILRPQHMIESSNITFGKPLWEGEIAKLHSHEGPSSPLGVTGYQDIDAHAHVNSVRYYDWALSGYDKAWHEEHRLTEASANFTSELGWNEVVYRTSLETPDGHTHIIHRGDATVPSAIIKYRWEQRVNNEQKVENP